MSSKRFAKTHFENRFKLCVICKKKQKSLQKLQPLIIIILENNSDFKRNDDRLPASVCVGCKFKVIKANNANKDELGNIIPTYIEFYSSRLLRSSSKKKCACTLCTIVQDGYWKFKGTLNANRAPKTIRQNHMNIVKNGKSVSVVGEVEVYNDLKDRIIKELTPKQREHLLSDLIKDTKKAKSVTDVQREVSLSQIRGRSLRIALNPKNRKPKVTQISASDMVKVQTNRGFSLNEMLGIAKDLRVSSSSRKLFEPNLREKLSVSNHTLDSFFTVKVIEFVHVVGKKQTILKQPFVYCQNIKQLCECVQAKRKCFAPHLKFGIDGGGGFLKITLSIQDMQRDTDDTRRQRYAEGVAAKEFKDSGVKKLFLIGVAPATQENYENVQLLWSILKINDMDGWTVATDLKLANILIGLMTHASSHPCTWCTALKGLLNQCGKYRTFGDCQKLR